MNIKKDVKNLIKLFEKSEPTEIKEGIEERLKNVFGDNKIRPEFIDIYVISGELEKSYKLIEFDGNSDSIIKVKIGKVTFYVYVPKDNFPLQCLENSEMVNITQKHDLMELVEFISLQKLIIHYILQGENIYFDLLRSIFKKERISEVVKKYKICLAKYGKCKIPAEYHQYFSNFKMDENGWHVVG